MSLLDVPRASWALNARARAETVDDATVLTILALLPGGKVSG